MKISLSLKAVTIILSVILFAGCYYDNEALLYGGGANAANCDSVQATFNAKVKPLINAKCGINGCHGASGPQIPLVTYDQISGAKARVIERAVNQKSMPPSGALPAAERDIIKCWVDAGAMNN